jgi:hypothetical protein
MEVPFTLVERYERKSLLITSNLVFTAWIRIFKDPMTTRRPSIDSFDSNVRLVATNSSRLQQQACDGS